MLISQNNVEFDTAIENSLDETTTKNTPDTTLANMSLNQSQKEMLDTTEKPSMPITLPRPVLNLTLNDQPNLKVLFLFDELYLKQFTDDLFDMEAAVKPKADSDEKQIRIECSLPNTSSQAAHQEWHKKVNDYLTKFFGQFEICLIQISDIDEILKRVTYDTMRVECTRIETNCVELCGFKELVEKLATAMYAERDKRLEDEQEIVEETRSGLKLFQIRVLFVNKYIKQMRDKHANLTVKIDAKNSIVGMKGTRAQIKDANENLDSIIKSIKTSKYPADDLLIKLIENKEMDVVTWLKDQVNFINRFIFNKILGMIDSWRKKSEFRESLND